MLPEINSVVLGLSVAVALYGWWNGANFIRREGWAFIFCRNYRNICLNSLLRFVSRVMPSSLGAQLISQLQMHQVPITPLKVMTYVAVVMTPVVLIIRVGHIGYFVSVQCFPDFQPRTWRPRYSKPYPA